MDEHKIQEGLDEAHRLGIDAALRKLSESGEKTEAPFKAMASRQWDPGRQLEHTVKLKAGALRIVAVDHSPDGMNPTEAWLGKTLVYQAEDYGAKVVTFKPGPWVEQLLSKTGDE
jgi:hypothetical protein